MSNKIIFFYDIENYFSIFKMLAIFQYLVINFQYEKFVFLDT